MPQKELANGTVSLPFGTEYALRLRNKHDRRAVVKIYIDGENISGGGYVVNAHSHVDIKRHHDKDRAFKFVSLDSAEAVDFGKNGPNPDKVKGTIEAHFFLEKKQELPKIVYRDHHHHHHHHDHHHWPKPEPQPWVPYQPYPIWTSNTDPMYRNVNVDYSCNSDVGGGGSSCSLGMSSATPRGMCSKGAGHESFSFNASPPLQDGCTVEGYSTGQTFYSTYVDYEESATVLKVFLQGHEPPERVEEVAMPRKTNKERVIDDLEVENEELRRKIAELENEKLKKQLEGLQG